jgi:AAA+ ATPase superfamily predicted ATPase
MDKFIGRNTELDFLERLYDGPDSKTCAIYGRRRIGKTALIEEFCKDKKVLFFSAVEGTLEINLDRFENVLKKLGVKITNKPKNLSEFLYLLRPAFGTEKLVIVFDEFPYVSAADRPASSDLQVFIDHELKKMNALLMICGSSIGAMKEEMDGAKRPLFGRFLNRIKLAPLSFIECREFHPDFSDEDNMSLYLITGGIPMFYDMMPGNSLDMCIKNAFLRPVSPMCEEALSTVYRELSPSGAHISVLSAIANGATQLKTIAEKCHFSEPLCSGYISNLIFLDLVEKVTPMGNAPKRPVYRVSDNLLSFYLTVIVKKLPILKGTDTNSAYHSLKHDIDIYMGHAFEYACSEFIMRNHPCRDIGKWWGRVGSSDTDIDIVAVIAKDEVDVTLFAECKYSSGKVGLSALTTLKIRSEYATGFMNRRYCLFSKSGFSEDITEYAETYGISLITVEQMYSGAKIML